MDVGEEDKDLILCCGRVGVGLVTLDEEILVESSIVFMNEYYY